MRCAASSKKSLRCTDAKRRSRAGVVFIGFFVIAGVLLFTEHRAHVLGALVFLPLLLCPLMHLFMHGGHGSHSGHAAGSQSNPERTSS